MKKLVFTLATAMLLLVLALSVNAASVEDLTFTLNSEGTEYSVSGFNRRASGEVVIPSSYNGLPVTHIAREAFYNCNVTKVVIPSGVTDIGEYAFYWCRALETIVIPNTVTSIGYEVFYNCLSLENITIPSSVTSIGEKSFEYCKKIVKAIDGIQYVGNWIVGAEASITNAKIKSGTVGIATGTFKNCINLTSITIPGTVKVLQSYIFSECENFKTVVISEGVTSIGEYAFYGCINLENINIPNSVTSIGEYAFSQCEKIFDTVNDICYVDKWVIGYDGSGNAVIRDGSVGIASYAFNWCNALKSISLPDSVKNIGNAFYSCDNLENITVDINNKYYSSKGNCLVDIRTKTLIVGCDTTVIPDDGSVESIGDYAFMNRNMSQIIIPDSVNSIHENAFYKCYNLTVYCYENTYVHSYVLDNNIGYDLLDRLITFTLINGKEYKITSCKPSFSGKIYIPKKYKGLPVTEIGDSSFLNCINLTGVYIPDSVVKIGTAAFKNCASLVDIKVDVNNKVYHSSGNCIIETETKTLIQGCKTSIVPDDGSVTKISPYSFYDSTGLLEIRLSDKVKIIADNAFYGFGTKTEAINTQKVNVKKSTEYDNEMNGWNGMSTWSSVITSYVFEISEDKFGVLNPGIVNDIPNIYLDIYDKNNHRLLETKLIAWELNLFGGLYLGDEYNYIVFGQYNVEENDNAEVIRVVKYDKSFKRLSSATVKDCYTIVPFDAGCLRMSEKDGELIIHTSRLRYTSADGLNHQSQLTIVIDVDNMSVKNYLEAFQDNHVSHSFNQFVKHDGTAHVLLDHGDGYPRGVALNINKENRYTEFVMFEVPGEVGENYTGIFVGGFEISSNNYLAVINSIDHSKVIDYSGGEERDIILLVSAKNNLNANNVKQIYLTDYADNNKTGSKPYLVKISDNRFVVLWEEFIYVNDYTLNSNGVKYVFVDEYGNALTDIRHDLNAHLSNECQPILMDGKIIWIVDNIDKRLVYSFDAYLSFKGIEFNNAYFDYDGKQKELLITGTLPSGAVVNYVNNKATAKGKYNVTAKITADGYYPLELHAMMIIGDYTYGDIDSDGIVTNKDSAIVARYLARWTGYEVTNPLYNFDAADVDCDGVVTNKDSAIIARHLARWTGYEALPKV